MDWNRVYVWTRTLYAVVHSLHMAKEVNFGDLDSLDRRFRDANAWVSPTCSYSTMLLPSRTKNKKLKFRREPAAHFGEISNQLIKMLVQDLTVIFDEMMGEALETLELEAGDMPQSKIEKLATLLPERYKWSEQGCRELVAVRNSLCHANGRWNEKSLKIISGFVSPQPRIGDEIIIGFEMLFNYRKAMRTFLNQTCPSEAEPRPKDKNLKSLKPKKSKSISIKQKRKTLVKGAASA